MKLFQIVTDTGTEFQRSFVLAHNDRAIKAKKPDGVTYLKVEDVTDRYPIDGAFLESQLAAAGYGDTERLVILGCLAAYDGANPHAITSNE